MRSCPGEPRRFLLGGRTLSVAWAHVTAAHPCSSIAEKGPNLGSEVSILFSASQSVATKREALPICSELVLALPSVILPTSRMRILRPMSSGALGVLHMLIIIFTLQLLHRRRFHRFCLNASMDV